MADIFLSYASEDRERLRPLVETLEAEGWRIWWDRDLHAGARFDVAIEEAIRVASCVVVAWSEHSIQSAWVRDEASEGQERNIFVPFMLDDVRPPMGFRAAQTASLVGWPEARGEIDMLLAGIRELVGSGKAAETASQVVGDASSGPGSTGVPAIAVLAFDNLSGDPEQEYFVNGMAEDLITRLSAERGLRVIARNSSFVYKGRAVDVKQVSRDLGVRYVVEGSVRKSGDQVRISIQLINAASGHHVWASTYDRELRDVFALQDEISQTIVGSLLPEMAAIEQERVMHRNPQNLDAYENVLRGTWHLFKLTQDDNAEARSFFERAAELDPNYARAYSGIAQTCMLDAENGWGDSRTQSTAEFERAAQRCVALDPRDAECVGVLAAAQAATGHLDEAISLFERATQLNPSYWQAHQGLGSTLAVAGRSDEAIASIETAMHLSPHDPFLSYCFGWVGRAHFAAERYEDAVDWSRRAVHAGNVPFLEVAVSSYAHLGRLDDAHGALEQLRRHEPDYSLAKVKQQQAFMIPSILERFLDGLRMAGMKE